VVARPSPRLDYSSSLGYRRGSITATRDGEDLKSGKEISGPQSRLGRRTLFGRLVGDLTNSSSLHSMKVAHVWTIDRSDVHRGSGFKDLIAWWVEASCSST
jgi:hypothetical protein